MTICQENLYYTSKFQKQTNNKNVKPKSYTASDKVWLNSKYIKIKQNQKFKAKFFRLFQVLQSIGKQAYKVKLPKN